MNPFGETRSFTAACVCDREREGILDCRPSTLTSQVKWEENRLKKKKQTPLKVSSSITQSFSSPSKPTFKACL